jgi:hypothetical protein
MECRFEWWKNPISGNWMYWGFPDSQNVAGFFEVPDGCLQIAASEELKK